MFDFILRNFEFNFRDFNKGNSKEKDLEMLVQISELKMIENVRGSDQS